MEEEQIMRLRAKVDPSLPIPENDAELDASDEFYRYWAFKQIHMHLPYDTDAETRFRSNILHDRRPCECEEMHWCICDLPVTMEMLKRTYAAVEWRQ